MAEAVNCLVDGCTNHKWARGLCGKHYYRWRKHGDPGVNLAPKNVPVMERIAAKTDRSAGSDGCWPFSGGNSNARSGHRQVWLDGGMRTVHRVVWEDANGPIPDGLVVRHSCDNPPCVNPAHLLLGTVADNNRDRDRRGRHTALRGVKNGQAKLTRDDVRKIRRLAASGDLRQREIAARYGVSQGLVSLIHLRKTWTHV